MPNIRENEDIYKELSKYANVTSEPIYSTVTYATSGNKAATNFFDGSSTKTTTNLTKDRELPQGHKMIVEEIRVSVMPDVTLADLQEFLKDAVLEFAPNEDARPRYFPISMLGAGGGVSGAWSEATASDQYAVVNGQPQQNAVFKLRRPEVLRGGVPFVCKIHHPAAITPAAATKVTVILSGLYAYPAAQAAS